MGDSNELESNIEKYFVSQVRTAGGWPLKLVSPGTAGMPDRLVLWPGGIVNFVELKRPGKKPRALQVARIKRLREYGQSAVWLSTKKDVDIYVMIYREEENEE